MTRYLTALALLTALVVSAGGCSYFQRTAVSPNPSAAPDAKRAVIFIDGRNEGYTPASVRVRRGFGESEVLLQVGSERVRTFSIEWSDGSSSRSELDFSFKGRISEGYLSFTLADLPIRRDSIHVVPYYPVPVKIEDLEYGLTLLVTE